jgi:4-carboxymuconolactone decarboxylase
MKSTLMCLSPRGVACPTRSLETIVARQRPSDLTREEGIAYDMAAALVSGGTLPELTWRSAIRTFGAAGAAELSFLIGLYRVVSVTLNTFDVPLPERAEVRYPVND